MPGIRWTARYIIWRQLLFRGPGLQNALFRDSHLTVQKTPLTTDTNGSTETIINAFIYTSTFLRGLIHVFGFMKGRLLLLLAQQNPVTPSKRPFCAIIMTIQCTGPRPDIVNYNHMVQLQAIWPDSIWRAFSTEKAHHEMPMLNYPCATSLLSCIPVVFSNLCFTNDSARVVPRH